MTTQKKFNWIILTEVGNCTPTINYVYNVTKTEADQIGHQICRNSMYDGRESLSWNAFKLESHMRKQTLTTAQANKYLKEYDLAEQTDKEWLAQLD